VYVAILSLYLPWSVTSFAAVNCGSHGQKKPAINKDSNLQDAEIHGAEEKAKSQVVDTHGAEEKAKSQVVDTHGAEEKAKSQVVDTHGAEEKKISEEAPEVIFTAANIKKHGIEMGEAKPGTIYKTVGGPGEILLNEDKVAHVSPKVSGVAVKIFKSLGDKVSEGEILAIFESAALGETKIEYYTAKTKLDLAKLDYDKDEKVYKNTKTLLGLLKSGLEPSEIIAQTENNPVGEVKTKLLTAYSQRRQLEAALSRSDKLQSKGVVSVADLELKNKEYQSANAVFRGAVEDVELGIEQTILKSRRELMIAETAMSNAERKLYMIGLGKEDIEQMEKNKLDKHVSSYQLKSPISGVIIERHLANGEQADQENNCFTVADLSSLWCDINLRPKDLVGIARNGKAIIQSDAGNFTAEITTVSPTIEDKTRAGFVRVTINNPNNILKPGLFVDGKVIISNTAVNIVVPVDAVQTFEGKEVVFKQGCEENEFAVQPITRGISDDMNVEIIDGLKAGDKIAVKGVFLIKAEFAKGKAGGCADAH
jgi:cobalt-zinc-cadmium efflux system membrane fusion protein